MIIQKYFNDMATEDQKDLTVQFEEKLKSLSDEYNLTIININLEYIVNLLDYLPEILDSFKPETNPKLQSALMKVSMLKELIPKSAEEFESLDILKVLLECHTDIF